MPRVWNLTVHTITIGSHGSEELYIQLVYHNFKALNIGIMYITCIYYLNGLSYNNGRVLST